MQLILLDKAKKYLFANPNGYLNGWAIGTIGYLKLQCLYEGALTNKKYFIYYIKNLISLGYQQDLYVESNYENAQYKNIVISWSSKQDFLEDGSFQCRYFNYNSTKIKDVLWVLISLDNFVPLLKDKNIIIFRKKQVGRFSMYTFVKNLFFCINNCIPWAAEHVFSKKLIEVFTNKICVDTIEKILCPYEAQPWQHMLFEALKKKNKNISIIGDLHSCLPPFPSDFLKRYGAPNKVLVHGFGQKDIMVNILGWSTTDIEVVPSRIFVKNNHMHLVNKILLPYSFGDLDFILKTLEFFFRRYKNILPLLELRNHPVQLNSQHHKKLMKNIAELKDKIFYDVNNVISDKIAVVIGASSVIIECLTHGIKVFQIVENPMFEIYSPKIWENLKINYISQNIVEYELSEKINYLEFGNNSLEEVFAND